MMLKHLLQSGAPKGTPNGNEVGSLFQTMYYVILSETYDTRTYFGIYLTLITVCLL